MALIKALIKILAFLASSLVLALMLSVPTNLLLYWLFQPLTLFGLRTDQLLSDLKITDRLEVRVTSFSLVPALLIASLVMTRLVERRFFATLGLSLFPGCFREFGIGALLALFSIVPLTITFLFVPYIPTIAEGPLGEPGVYVSNLTGWIVISIVFAFLIIVAALFEELIFRGYPFQTLMASVGKWPTAFVVSILFALAHYQTHYLSAMTVAGFIGLLLAVMYLQSKSLWMPLGFHVAFNGLSLVVGTVLLRVLGWTTEQGENWLLAATTVITTLILLVWIFKFLKPSPTMETLWQQHVPVARPWAQLKAWWARRKGVVTQDQTPPTPPAS